MKGTKTIKAVFLGNLSMKFLSLALAVALWMWVTGEQKTEMNYTVPIEVKNLSSDLMVFNDPFTKSAQVALRGTRTDLLSLSPKQVKIMVDLKGAREGERYYYFRPQDIETPRGIEVVSITPTRVKLVLESVAEKTVTVVPQLKGKPARGYEILSIDTEPDEVTVVGPRSLVNGLRRIDTLPVDISGAKGKISRDVGLDTGDDKIKPKDYRQVTVSVNIVDKREVGK